MASDDPAPLSFPNDPHALDRKGVERVLARAAELHLAERDPRETIDEARLYEIAREAGLSPAAVAQALAEERTRVALTPARADDGPLGRWAGPVTVSAQRIVHVTPPRALATVDQWMQQVECLQIQRQFPERVVWEPRDDFSARMRRAWRLGGRQYILSHARTVAVTIADAGEGRLAVRLDADITARRVNRAIVGVSVGASGVLAGSVLAVFGTLIATPLIATAVIASAVAAPLIAGGVGALILRSHRTFAERVQLALEQSLDQLAAEPPAPPATLFGTIARHLLR